MIDPLGYYALLDLPLNFDENGLKISYREKAKFWHPDHNKSPEAMENFQKLAVAYEILKNPQSKMVYDILATVYETSDFPDMKALKIYCSAKGEETPYLRVFNLYKMVGFKLKVQKLIGTFTDAISFISKITAHNWLKGWWTPQAFKQNIFALKQNYQGINANTTDNYKLLAHNAAAFLNENKIPNACLSAYQALEYATTTQQRRILELFLAKCRFEKVTLKPWDFKYLQKIQLKFLYALLGILSLILIAGGAYFASTHYTKGEPEKTAYYQKVRFNSGSETVDDMVTAKIFNIPADTKDTTMLYHLTSAQKIMYGPSEKFDVMTELKKGHTVRITGYTVDKLWARVMLDDGQMGFVLKKHLEKGVQNEIPAESKIFETTNEKNTQ